MPFLRSHFKYEIIKRIFWIKMTVYAGFLWLLIFLVFFLRFNWQIDLWYASCTMWWFDTHIHYERISIIELTLITSHVCLLCVWCVSTLKFYYLSKLQLYNTLFFIIVTVLYIRSSDLIHLLTERLCIFIIFSPFFHPPKSLATTCHYCHHCHQHHH